MRNIIIIFCFFVWILPLGAFIKPSDEIKVCGGQRAICLCSNKSAVVKVGGLGKVVITKGSTQKEQAQSGGASEYLAALNIKNIFRPNVIGFIDDGQFLYAPPYTIPIEHVPKA
jgi:hypothetical protein